MSSQRIIFKPRCSINLVNQGTTISDLNRTDGKVHGIQDNEPSRRTIG